MSLRERKDTMFWDSRKEAKFILSIVFFVLGWFKMRFYIYATHSEGYYEDLLDSLRVFDADYTIDGFGETWIGYRQKLEGILKFARAQDDNQVISVLDAFDSLLVENPVSMEQHFRMSGKDLIYAHDHHFLYSNYFGKKYREKKWGCAKPLLNAGASIGFASTYVTAISRILEKLDRDEVLDKDVDDQRELCLYMKYHTGMTNMATDERSEYFYLSMSLKGFLPKDGHRPWVISGPGKQSLRLYVHWMRRRFIEHYWRIPIRHEFSRLERAVIKFRGW